MSKVETQELKPSQTQEPRMRVFQGVIEVKVRERIREALDDLKSALEMFNHATNPELPNPNYLLCSYVDLENALENVKEAMKELEKLLRQRSVEVSE